MDTFCPMLEFKRGDLEAPNGSPISQLNGVCIMKYHGKELWYQVVVDFKLPQEEVRSEERLALLLQ